MNLDRIWNGLGSPARALLNKLGWDLRRAKNNPEFTLLGLKKLRIKTIIDIGANRGQFALAMSKIFPEAAVFAFEPLPDDFNELEFWLPKRFSQSHAFNMALGDTDGSVLIRRHKEHSPSSSILATTAIEEQLYPFTKVQDTLSVKMMRLDTAMRPYAPSLGREVLVKIDVQGYEDRVIRGGQGTIASAAACIVELNIKPLYQGQARFLDIVASLNEIGFNYAGNLSQFHTTDGQVIFVDCVFKKNG